MCLDHKVRLVELGGVARAATIKEHANKHCSSLIMMCNCFMNGIGMDAVPKYVLDAIVSRVVCMCYWHRARASQLSLATAVSRGDVLVL